jgi:hypothetical protein
MQPPMRPEAYCSTPSAHESRLSATALHLHSQYNIEHIESPHDDSEVTHEPARARDGLQAVSANAEPYLHLRLICATDSLREAAMRC